MYFIQATTTNLHKRWMEKNKQVTKDACEQLLIQLKKDILDPVLSQLTSAQASSLTFKDITKAYNLIESKYKKLARGAEDVRACVFANVQPVSVHPSSLLPPPGAEMVREQRI